MNEVIEKPKNEHIRLVDIIIMNYVTLVLMIASIIGVIIILGVFMPCWHGAYNRGVGHMDLSWVMMMMMFQYIFWAFPITRLFTKKYLTLNPKRGLEKCLRTLFIMSIPVIFALIPKIWLYFGVREYKINDGIQMLITQSILIALSLLIVNVTPKIIIKGYSNISKYKLFVISFNFILLSVFAFPALFTYISEDNLWKTFLKVVLFFYPVIYSIFAYIELNYLPWGKREEKQLKGTSKNCF